MSRIVEQVGFSQRVRLEWLEHTANLVLAGNDKIAINTALQELLQDKVSVGGDARRGTREKIITILMKVWINVPPQLEALRDDGLKILQRLPRKDRIAVHWGMVTAVYPFWSVVAAHVGRLLKLQGSAAASHIQRRLREQYGERETVSRATRRVLRSFLDWEVLSETGKKGIYSQGLALAIDDSQLVSWIIETSLFARPNHSAALKDLFEHPSLFPFRIKKITADSLLATAARLDLLSHNLDDELVLLRTQTLRKGRRN
jgi:hypothetical protein